MAIAQTPRSAELNSFLDKLFRRPLSGDTPGQYDALPPANKFMVNMLMLLTQLIDPDNQSNESMVGLISRAFGFDPQDRNHKQYRELRQDIQTRGRDAAREGRDFSKLDHHIARDAISAGTA